MQRIIASKAPASVILIRLVGWLRLRLPKVPIMLGHGFWRFSVSKLPSYGFWAMAHEARVDFAMLLGSLFLLIVGAGARSIDAHLRISGSPARRN
jgi:putative oxidoreductase